MSLSELLESRFRGDIRFRGVAYLKAERVSLTRISPDHVFGLVRDGVEYQTHLSREEGRLRMFCNCHGGAYDRRVVERWAADPGMSTWDYAHCLPYFKRMENCLADENSGFRGHDGPLVLERGPATSPSPETSKRRKSASSHHQAKPAQMNATVVRAAECNMPFVG